MNISKGRQPFFVPKNFSQDSCRKLGIKCVCVLFCAEASFLDERPLTTPSLFLPHFPLDLSSTDPFFLPTHPTPPPPPFIFFVCSLFSLFLCFLPFLGFSPHHQISLILRLYTRARWGQRLPSPPLLEHNHGGHKRSFQPRASRRFFLFPSSSKPSSFFLPSFAVKQLLGSRTGWNFSVC